MQEYQLLSNINPSVLSAQVNSYLQKGWELYGMPWNNNGCFAQAVVKNCAQSQPKPQQQQQIQPQMQPTGHH